MKKFTLLLAALAISLVTFAQAKITYELNGGATNDFGWKSKAEIALDLQNDYNATYETSKAWALDSMGVIYYKRGSKWVTPDVVQGQASTLSGFIQASTWTETYDFIRLIDSVMPEKYSWLKEVVSANREAQGLSLFTGVLKDDDPILRKEISGFFLASPADASWPATSSFEVTADYAAFAPIWKHAFCGPDSIFEGETIELPVPYKEDESFVGWYRTPDFSDERLTELTYTKGETEIVLYAKYGEYIPCVKEVIAMANDSITKVQGTVSYVASSNFWIQDATGGILCYGKNHGLAEGDLVVLAGKKTIYNGSPELALDSVVEKRAGKPVSYQTAPLAAIVADTLAYLNEFVYIEGVTFSRYEDKGNYKTPYVTDGMTEIALYNWADVTEDKYPIGMKVSLKAVLAIYNTDLQLRGKAEWITEAAAAGLDLFEYPEVEVPGFKFNFTNNWLYSVNLGNWNENRPNALAEGSRSVVEKDGILYFSYRDNNTPNEQPKLVRVEAATGKMLTPVIYANNIFKDSKGAWLFGPYTDLKLDNEGNAITSNLPTSGGAFQIWNVDLETGEGKLIVDLSDSTKWLSAQFPENTTIRLDRIGVYGDINGDARIMSVVSNGADVYYWDIVDGEWDGETYWIPLGLPAGQNVGGAPVICPIEGDMFYIDGFATYPLLFDIDGNLLDAFDEAHEADHLLIGANGVSRANGHNGVTEFEVNGEYYLIIAGDNTNGNGTAPSTFVLYKFKDEVREFKGMSQLYEFPMAGMGAVSNPQRVATSFAKPNEEGTAVDIYAFTSENGYGSYTMTIEEVEIIDAVENVTLNFDIWVENNTISADVEIEGIFTVTGQNVTALNGKLTAGAYIVRTAEGVAKVMIK